MKIMCHCIVYTDKMEKEQRRLEKIAKVLRATIQKELSAEIMQETVDKRLALLKVYNARNHGGLPAEGKKRWREIEHMYKLNEEFLPKRVDYQVEMKLLKA
jgi:hypothetical protein